MITLAFYKGRSTDLASRLQDAAIRCATRGRYSHVELIAGSAALDRTARCLSASGRDGGVREKIITLKAGHWDLIELDIDAGKPAQFIRDRIGARYDLLGALTCWLPLWAQRSSNARWFCSEIIAAALDMPDPQTVSPQALYSLVATNQKTNLPA